MRFFSGGGRIERRWLLSSLIYSIRYTSAGWYICSPSGVEPDVRPRSLWYPTSFKLHELESLELAL